MKLHQLVDIEPGDWIMWIANDKQYWSQVTAVPTEFFSSSRGLDAHWPRHGLSMQALHFLASDIVEHVHFES